MWIGSTPSCFEVSQAIEQYCDVRTATSEQHVEMRDYRQSSDANDIKKLVVWLNFHSSYSQQTTQMISLSIGFIGKGGTNCNETIKCGSLAIAHMLGKNFAEIKPKRNDNVKSISSVNKCIKIRDDVIPVNSQQLFNRMICIATKTSKLEECLCYELSPYQTACFWRRISEENCQLATYDSFGKIFSAYFGSFCWYLFSYRWWIPLA